MHCIYDIATVASALGRIALELLVEIAKELPKDEKNKDNDYSDPSWEVL